MSSETPSPEELARRLHTAARYASVGKVAAGAAHEINQPLNVIRMAAFNVRRAIQKGRLDPESAIEKLEKIDAQIDRAARLVGGMKAFSPTSQALKTAVKPSVSIAVSLELLAKRFTVAEAELRHQAIETDCEVQAEPTALQELVINLVENAVEAFGSAPKPAPSADGEEPEPRWIAVTEALEGDQFSVTISDNAGGMSAEVLAAAYDPFFTTASDASHPGLGLTICREIAEDLGGQLDIESDHTGTRVRVSFPVVVSPAEG